MSWGANSPRTAVASQANALSRGACDVLLIAPAGDALTGAIASLLSERGYVPRMLDEAALGSCRISTQQRQPRARAAGHCWIELGPAVIRSGSLAGIYMANHFGLVAMVADEKRDGP